jgi:hypothetical protein
MFKFFTTNLVMRFCGSPRHSMDLLPLNHWWSERHSRNTLVAIDPAFPSDDPPDDPPVRPNTPTPTDVPIPQPFDVPVPDPIDVPPTTPHDVPPPKPTFPMADPKPRSVP